MGTSLDWFYLYVVSLLSGSLCDFFPLCIHQPLPASTRIWSHPILNWQSPNWRPNEPLLYQRTFLRHFTSVIFIKYKNITNTRGRWELTFSSLFLFPGWEESPCHLALSLLCAWKLTLPGESSIATHWPPQLKSVGLIYSSLFNIHQFWVEVWISSGICPYLNSSLSYLKPNLISHLVPPFVLNIFLAIENELVCNTYSVRQVSDWNACWYSAQC